MNMTGVLIRRGQFGPRYTERTSRGDGGRVGVTLICQGAPTPTRDFQRVREPLLPKASKRALCCVHLDFERLASRAVRQLLLFQDTQFVALC